MNNRRSFSPTGQTVILKKPIYRPLVLSNPKKADRRDSARQIEQHIPARTGAGKARRLVRFVDCRNDQYEQYRKRIPMVSQRSHGRTEESLRRKHRKHSILDKMRGLADKRMNEQKRVRRRCGKKELNDRADEPRCFGHRTLVARQKKDHARPQNKRRVTNKPPAPDT